MTPERRQRLLSVLSKRQMNFTVLLENVFDPHNVSAVMRTCDAIGIQDIYILNNRIPPHRKWGFKSSSTAAQWLSVHQFDDAEKCFTEIRKNYESVYAGYLSEKSVDVYSMDFTKSMALVFGNETYGVSDEIRAFTDGEFVIPQTGVTKSLNISVACAVTLYEAFRQKRIAGHYEQTDLDIARKEHIVKKWGLDEM